MTEEQRAELENGEHVCFFCVPVISLIVSFVGAWVLAIADVLVAVIAYGLFGFTGFEPHHRFVAAAFSLAFVLMTLLGWGSWALSKIARARLSSRAKDQSQ